MAQSKLIQVAAQIVKIAFVAFGLFVVVICIGTVYILTVLDERNKEREINCATLSAEFLPTHVQQDLCERGLLNSSSITCEAPLTVKAIQTKEIFQSNIEVGFHRFNDVEGLFEKYRVYCNDIDIIVDNPAYSTYRCDYALNRLNDHQQGWPPVFIFFDKHTHIVQDIRTSACDAGS